MCGMVYATCVQYAELLLGMLQLLVSPLFVSWFDSADVVCNQIST